MLNFKRSFGDSFIFSSDRKRAIYCEENPLRLSTPADATSPIELHVPYRGLLFNNEKSKTEEQVGFLYLRCWQDDVLRLRASLDFPSRSPTHPSNTPIFKSNLLPPRLDNNAHIVGARGDRCSRRKRDDRGCCGMILMDSRMNERGMMGLFL